MKNKSLIVKKPDELIKMRSDFSESALKLSAYLISLLQEDKYIYNISIRDYLKKFDKNLGDFEKLVATAKELANRTFEFVNRQKKEFAIYNFLSRVTYRDGVLSLKIDDEFHQYLMMIKNKYLKYNLKNLMVLNSKYSIRLYELLKNQLEINKRYNKKNEYYLGIDDLKTMLKIPNSYKWQDIKRQVLEKSEKELKKTDLEFSFESIKTGRKVTHIKFFITDKSKKEKKVLSNNSQKNYSKNNFYNWKKEILQKAKNKIINLDEEYFILKDGLLADLDEKILSKEEAWSVWNNLFKNKNKVKLLEKNEIEKIEKEKQERVKEFELEQLKKEWLGVKLKDVYINGNYYLASVFDIQNYRNLSSFDVVFKIDNKFYKLGVSLNWLKSHSIVK